MRHERVALLPPSLDKQLSFHQSVEDPSVQQLVPQLFIRRLAVSLVRGTPRLDEQRLDAEPTEPVPYGLRCSLGSVIRSDLGRHPRAVSDAVSRSSTFSESKVRPPSIARHSRA
jgi:hypothetical protein